MATERPDYDTIRQRAEKRLEPLKKLRRLRLMFLLNLGLFIGMMFTVYSRATNSIFYQTFTEIYPSIDPLTNKEYTYEYTYTQPYPLVILISIVWFFLVLAHAIHVWSAYRHERAIQREMERETTLELERLRLQVELAKSGRLVSDEDDYVAEKSKRTMRLSDDGELLSEEQPRTVSRRRS
jgi:hypothetical protein